MVAGPGGCHRERHGNLEEAAWEAGDILQEVSSTGGRLWKACQRLDPRRDTQSRDEQRGDGQIPGSGDERPDTHLSLRQRWAEFGALPLRGKSRLQMIKRRSGYFKKSDCCFPPFPEWWRSGVGRMPPASQI